MDAPDRSGRPVEPAGTFAAQDPLPDHAPHPPLTLMRWRQIFGPQLGAVIKWGLYSIWYTLFITAVLWFLLGVVFSVDFGFWGVARWVYIVLVGGLALAFVLADLVFAYVAIRRCMPYRLVLEACLVHGVMDFTNVSRAEVEAKVASGRAFGRLASTIASVLLRGMRR